MKYLGLIIGFALSTLHVCGQTDTLITIETLIYDEEIEPQCDSVINININGNIKCKLIFRQRDYDTSNKNLIVIPYTKSDIVDNSILCSEHFSLSKTILKIGYDTCYVRQFNKSDFNRKLQNFTIPPDSSKIKDWDVDINFQQNGCTDTNYNSVRISKNKSDYIDFLCARRIKIYELDLNNDSMNEIYLISYVWCTSEIEIFRIDII